ncbi:pyrroline-5-carboxylate reductase [Basidiobolus meristosporus CBS 931.73]|uniref:Pyrroline-5-carboxylate reductase n=1 Tax=Basidiobolus meristosporus CBS 931.73 TaxID=1314790 RepID=A0A1Y1YXJ4_9FUNG|nr:pyrroline-5-carboxylate reductase [Basidiobolus meristosporus CBS 931.73]|eukprot:ORY02699.1 pyrroline-5-carboxylate reductase [Basidiobolus meristosporus CBS 931.73]
MTRTGAQHITFIGGGNMAEAIIGGLIENGFDRANITLSEIVTARAQYMHDTFGINLAPDNTSAITGYEGNNRSKAQVVVFAVKPQVMKQVALSLSSALIEAKPLVITIAAGIRTTELARWLSTDDNGEAIPGAEIPVVRCMPNTPALVLCGATGLYANRYATEEHKEVANEILCSISKTQWLEDEQLLDAVTAVSGSGPAYFFLMLEAMENAGVKAGLPKEIASALAVQTCLGAAKMAEKSGEEFAELRRRVTSPNGTTEAAITTMQRGEVREWIEKGVLAANTRSQELGEMFKD